MLGLGHVRQLCHPDTHMELAGPADAIICHNQKGNLNIISMTIIYRWRERMVVCHIVIGRVNVWWVLHFTSHSHWWRDTLPMDTFQVVTSHIRVLKYDKLYV